MLFKKIKVKEAYENGLMTVSYSQSGSMHGGYYKAECDLLSRGGTQVKVSRRSAVSAGQPELKKEKKVSADLFRAIDALDEKYRFHEWNGALRSDVRVLDGEETSVSLWYSDGRQIELSTTQDLPRISREFMQEVRELIEAYLK